MSRFVSEGSEEDNAAESNDAWTKAKLAVEALKKPTQTGPGSGLQEGGKSLYETLQANKEKKQAEFEESQRLKTQFQALNEEDIGFLDSVLESERAKEAAVRKDTAEQLDAFRRQREAAEKEAQERRRSEDKEASVTSAWVKKRRRKDADTGASINKLRKTSTSNKAPSEQDLVAKDTMPAKGTETAPERTTTAPTATLGLVAYDTDDD